MSLHRYPPERLLGDYARAGLGLALTMAPLFYGPGTVLTIALLMVAAVCAYFLARTVERHRAVVALDEDGVTLTSFTRSRVRWDDLARMTVAYYAVKRDKADGWMELTLRDAHATIKLDNRLEGFFEIVSQAARVARERRIPLNRITLDNLRALNITGE